MNRPGKGFSTVTPGNDAPFFAIFNNMRSYALGKESALLMASCPNGRPKNTISVFLGSNDRL